MVNLINSKEKFHYMKNTVVYIILFIAICLMTASCSKEVYFEEDGVQVANSTLTIRTRADVNNTSETGEESLVSYPVNIYVFNSEGKCVETTTIAEGMAEISMQLVEGLYTVYAIAGANSQNYDVPVKGNATKKSPIALKSDASHGDLMTASNVVTLVDGGENTLTLTLVRKVMLLQGVKIDKVPSSIKSVSVTIAPLYENVCLDGTYSGEAGTYTIELSKIDDTRTWENTDDIYLLEPSATNATISVNMTDGEGHSSSYSYTSVDELKANYKINISGTYTEEIGVELTGTIIGATWEGEKNITFNFDESGSSASENGGTDTPGTSDPQLPVISEPAPEVGTLYKDKYYVLKSQPVGSLTEVTLMALNEIEGFQLEDYTQEAVGQAIDGAMAELADGSDGVTGWRLPTIDEMEYIRDNFTEIRNGLRGFDSDISGTKFYFYQADDAISSYKFSTQGDTSDELTNETRLRIFTKLSFQ